ncbi:MAG TPA: hypothetical protein VGN95_15935 [Pyrinomonadaceae bacterium]|jgi:hypothetical protein|nr:hypothetical protein [Pyrinomonadaceae bacterium]
MCRLFLLQDGWKSMETVVGPQARKRLTNYLIIKSIIEILFVGAVAIGFYLTAFAPFFRGALDTADARNIAGWVVNQAEPQGHVEVQLYIDGQFAGDRRADVARPDVTAAGRAEDERHGFVFDTPPLAVGEHEARVYAVHESGQGQRRTLQLIGKPLHFSVAPDETKEEN